MKMAAVPRHTTACDAARSAPAAVRALSSAPGQALDASVRAFMESRFARDFRDVRVHTGESAASSAKDLRAEAYTSGRDIAFARGRYQPTTPEGLGLLAHELGHVAEQRGRPAGVVQRKAEGDCPAPRAPEPDYAALARMVHDGIDYIWGTDEELVYRGLRPLEKDPGRICKLKEVYEQAYKTPLMKDIDSDFSGTEEEYARQLLGEGKPGSDQRVQAAPLTTSGYLADARRLYEAGPDYTWGTDEEAIYAVLTPLTGKPEMKTLERVYLDQYKTSLRAMIEDEMSGSQRDYALDLLDGPQAKGEAKDKDEDAKAEAPAKNDLPEEDPQISAWIKEAFDKLQKQGVGLAVWWERREDGSTRWDDRYWTFENEEAYKQGKMEPKDAKLKLRPTVAPHVAVDALFGEQHRWDMDCGQFVQVLLLYVRRKLMQDDAAFDRWAGSDLTLRTHAPEELRHALFRRAVEDGVPKDAWLTSPSGRFDRLSEEQMLESAPAGTQIRWTSSWTKEAARIGQAAGLDVERTTWFAFQNENAVKISKDKYAAHGLGEVGQKELVTDMTDATRQALGAMAPVSAGKAGVKELPSNLNDAQIQERVYVSFIEYFRWKSG